MTTYAGLPTTPPAPTRGPNGAAEVTAGDGAGGAGGGVPPHRVLRFARAVEDAFLRLGEEPAWSMTAAEQGEALLVLDRLGPRLAELQGRVLAAAVRNEVGAETGATSTAAWLAHQTRQTRARCAAAARLAEALDERYDATRRGLAAGRVNVDQAQVIVQAVDALTREHDDLPAGVEARAEAHLLDLAGEFDAVALRRLGKRLFEVVCPEAADRVEGEKLEREEERARRKASLSMRDNGDGTGSGFFKLPTVHAALLKKALEALTSPRRLGEGRLDPRPGRRSRTTCCSGRGSWSCSSATWILPGCRPRAAARSRWWSPSASTH